jgi:hypothetical protein
VTPARRQRCPSRGFARAARTRSPGRRPLRLSSQGASPRPVDRSIDDDAMQPGPEGSATVEAVERADGGQEGFLRDVLRRRPVLDDQVRRSVRAPPVAAKEGLERFSRSGLRGPNPYTLIPVGDRRVPSIGDREHPSLTGLKQPIRFSSLLDRSDCRKANEPLRGVHHPLYERDPRKGPFEWRRFSPT